MLHSSNKASQLTVESIDHMSIVIDTKAAKWKPRNREARFLSVKGAPVGDGQPPFITAFKAASEEHRGALRRLRTGPAPAPRSVVDVSKASPLLTAFKAASAAHRAKHGG